jgi:transposase
MGKRRKFTNEFKLEAVRLAERGDVPVAQVARELGLNETVLRRWMGLYGKRAGVNRMTPEEHEELIRLRREVRRVTEERDILKKAVSIFSATRPADKSKELR